jgi:hypothetical protein
MTDGETEQPREREGEERRWQMTQERKVKGA